jgi:hemoglobin
MNQAATQTSAPPFERIGGEPVVRRLVDSFYRIMDESPEAAPIRAMHAKDLGPMSDRLTDYLVGWLGGPSRYNQRPDAKCIMSAHEPYAIGVAESEQWMNCMRRALTEAGISTEMRTLIEPAFERVAKGLRNR